MERGVWRWPRQEVPALSSDTAQQFLGRADLTIVGFRVGDVIKVQWGLPTKPPAVQAHVLVCHHIVDVLMGRQWPNQLTCRGVMPALTTDTTQNLRFCGVDCGPGR